MIPEEDEIKFVEKLHEAVLPDEIFVLGLTKAATTGENR